MSIQSEFSDWKANPMTIRVFKGLKEYETLLAERLVTSAGNDPLEDKYTSGYIAALRDLYLIRMEDTGETE